MLLLTRLDGSPVLIAVEAIKYAEEIPDTHILFLNGDSIIVRESLAEIQRSMVKLRSEILFRSRGDGSGEVGDSPEVPDGHN